MVRFTAPDMSAAPASKRLTLFPASSALLTIFHIFAIEWNPESVSFYVDKDLYVRRTHADLKPGWKWVFDKPFF